MIDLNSCIQKLLEKAEFCDDSFNSSSKKLYNSIGISGQSCTLDSRLNAQFEVQISNGL